MLSIEQDVRYSIFRSFDKCCQCACRRPTYQYEAEHIEGAVNVPTFRPVAGKGKWDIIKKIAMAGLAMKATGQQITASWHTSTPFVICMCLEAITLLRDNTLSVSMEATEAQKCMAWYTCSLMACTDQQKHQVLPLLYDCSANIS